MTFQSLFVLLSLVVMMVLLMGNRMRSGMIIYSFAILFMAVGIITPEEALLGFSNKGVMTVAILFLVSEGIRQTGGLNKITEYILSSKSSGVRGSLMKILPSVGFISAFLNNTAVVIIFAPLVKRWANSMKIPATKLLIPLSYATILGGMCTLIGTSTNLVVHGLMVDSGYDGFSMFELGKVGVVIAIIGVIYLVLFGHKLLPGVSSVETTIKEKEYFYEIEITQNSRFIGMKVVNCKIPLIPMSKIAKIIRAGVAIETNNIDLQAGDLVTLKCIGVSGCIERIIHTEGIVLSCLKELDKSFIERATHQVEAVIAPRFQGVGKSIDDFDFFRHYGGVVIAINRLGAEITTNLDKHIMKEGDNLIILTDGKFIKSWGESTLFYLVSEIGSFTPPSKKKGRYISMILVLFMIIGAAAGRYIDSIFNYFTGEGITHYFPWLDGVEFDMFYFAAIVVIIMAWANIFPQKKYTKFIRWDILITIASSFAISKALINSGVASLIANYLIEISASMGHYGILALLYIITNICTEVVTNNAAVALSFPIAVAVAEQLGIDPYPLFVAISIAASASFSTPIGYQTNLIVQAIGNYKFRDYLRVGLPLNVIAFLISLFMIPIFWKF